MGNDLRRELEKRVDALSLDKCAAQQDLEKAEARAEGASWNILRLEKEMESHQGNVFELLVYRFNKGQMKRLRKHLKEQERKIAESRRRLRKLSAQYQRALSDLDIILHVEREREKILKFPSGDVKDDRET